VFSMFIFKSFPHSQEKWIKPSLFTPNLCENINILPPRKQVVKKMWKTASILQKSLHVVRLIVLTHCEKLSTSEAKILVLSHYPSHFLSPQEVSWCCTLKSHKWTGKMVGVGFPHPCVKWLELVFLGKSSCEHFSLTLKSKSF
jgi:hypothetical protein